MEYYLKLNNNSVSIQKTISELLFNIVNSETFKDDNNVPLLFNVVNPDTLNDYNNVELLFNIVSPDTINDNIKVALLFNIPALINMILLS